MSKCKIKHLDVDWDCVDENYINTVTYPSRPVSPVPIEDKGLVICPELKPKEEPENIEPFNPPPQTPSSDIFFTEKLPTIPKVFPSMNEFQIPYIREVGVKSCMEQLGIHFHCLDYEFNPTQFWFLDIITDCLWRMQDEFQFSEHYQKIIIEWILYVIDLIRDPTLNRTRKRIFQIFKEGIEIAEEYIQNGCKVLPLPLDIFEKIDNNEEEMSASFSDFLSSQRDSSISVTSHQSGLAVTPDIGYRLYEIPKKTCPIDDSLISIEQEIFDYDDADEDDGEEEGGGEGKECLESKEGEEEFYKPDLSTPPRFKSLDRLIEPEEEGNPPDIITKDYDWRSSESSGEVPEHCPSTLFELEPDANIIIPEEEPKKPSILTTENYVQEWIEYMAKHEKEIKQDRKNLFINLSALYAIKTFVFDYFYESFQFKLVKYALIGSHNIITQRINQQWYVPKILRDVIKRPKEKKIPIPKPPKPPKEKPYKEMKPPKAPPAEPAKPKLTDEELLELEILRQLEKQREEARKAAELERKLLYPLTAAVDDNFYAAIFPGWKPAGKK